MLKIYRDTAGSIRESVVEDLPDGVIWLDLLDPTDDERTFVETRTGLQIPSREALSEIEASSRLIVRDEVFYFSTPVVARGDTDESFLSPAGFILSPRMLVTVRYAEQSTFDTVAELVHRDGDLSTSLHIFVALLEAIVDRGADVLEARGLEIERISRSVFRGDPTNSQHPVRSTESLRKALSAIGLIGDRISQARDVLLTVGRIAGFTTEIGKAWVGDDMRGRLGAVTRDIASLNDYEAHLANKVQFLLDAVLGYITIEQNDLFKVLTIASVVGIPPTVVVGVYGMNFKYMPELDWHWGYPFGLVLLVLSAVIPLAWFKARGWF